MAWQTAVLPLLRNLNRLDQRRYMRTCTRLLRGAGATVDGMPLWIAPSVRFDIAAPGSVRLGDRCVLSEDVIVLTHDFSMDRVAEERGELPAHLELVRKAPVEIGPRVFVGMRAIILPGVSIGRGSIVAAGAVVVGDVAPHTVVGGNPARAISTTDEFWGKRRGDFDTQERRR